MRASGSAGTSFLRKPRKSRWSGHPCNSKASSSTLSRALPRFSHRLYGAAFKRCDGRKINAAIMNTRKDK
jgi:hypothetical protein